MFRPIIPAIICIIVFAVWNMRSVPRSVPQFAGRLLFTGACFFLFNAFFLPLPVDARGFEAVSDPLLPMEEAIMILPFQSLVLNKYHLDYYFYQLLPMFAAAALMGFSINTAFSHPFTLKRNLMLSFLLPLIVFLFYAAIKLATGRCLKAADTTNIIWFMAAYFAGYSIFCLLSRSTSAAAGRKL